MGALANLFEDDAPKASMNLRFGIEAKPDDVARNAELAKRFGLPNGVIEQYRPEYEARAKLEDAKPLLDESPKLRGWLAGDMKRAEIAHDDIGSLSAVEKAVRFLGGAGDVVRAAVPGISGKMYGAAAAPFGVADQIIQALDDAAASVTGTKKRQIVGSPGPETFLLNEQKAAEGNAQKLMPDMTGWTPEARGLVSGLRSGVENLLTLPLGLAAGEAAMLGVMGAVTGGDSYGKARSAGRSPIQAAAFAAEDATAEIVTEKYLGAAGLLKNIKAGASAGKLFMYELAKEVPGEMIATVWQNFNEWTNLNPEKSVADFILEQPDALRETIVATLVGGGVQIGTVKGVERVLKRGEDKALQAEKAEKHAAALGEIATLIEAGKLRDRDAASFAEFAQQLTDDGTPNLYINAQMLNQSGIDLGEVAQSLPSVAAQIERAVATGGDLVIPTSEFLTIAPGKEFLAPLIEHARTAEDAMSPAEAKTYMNERGDALNEEIGKVLNEKQADDVFMAEKDAVKSEFLAQLNAAKRFTPDVNQAYAASLANFYSATAARMGMAPMELLKRYELDVSAKMVAGNQQYDQPGSPAFQRWFGASKVVDAQGKPLVVYHGTQRAEDGIAQFGASEGYAGQATAGVHWFTSSPKSASGYANWVKGVGNPTVYPVYAALRNPASLADLDRLGINEDPQIALYDQEVVSALKAAGYDGVMWTDAEYTGSKPKAGDSTTVVAFDHTQIKSAIGNNGNFDPTKASILEQGAGGRNLVALHNLSADNLLAAESLGGLPAPSIGIGRVDAPFSGFGEITLIGGSAMIDPAAGVPVFDSDAYTARFPELIWSAVPTKRAQALINEIRATAEELGDRSAKDQLWDSLVNTPDKTKAVDSFARSRTGMAMFLRERGESVDVPRKPVSLRNDWVRNPIMSEWMDKNFAAIKAMNEDVSSLDLEKQPLYAEMSAKVSEAIGAYFEPLGEAAKHDRIVRSTKSKILDDDTGLLNFNAYNRITADYVNLGQDEIDSFKLVDGLRSRVAPLETELTAWAEKKVGALFSEPKIKVGRRNVPVTLDNIVEAMTSGGVAGQEKSMTYGGGQARAAMSKRYKSMDEIRADRARIVTPEDHEAAKKNTEKVLESYRTLALEFFTIQNWRGEVDTWEGLDSSMRVLGAIGKHKSPTDAQISSALRKNDFEKFGPDLVAAAKAAALAMRETPVDYLEAKPQRAVRLDEFVAAAVPVGTPQVALDVLAKHNIQIIEYEKGDEAKRRAAIESATRDADERTGGGVLMQPGQFNKDGATGPRAQITFAQDITRAPSVITLLKDADLSSFIHESGHFYLEVMSDLASRIQGQINSGASVLDGEREIVADMGKLLDWFGIKGGEGQSALDEWMTMPMEQRREHHEKFARGFELHAFEGKAPSVELGGVFRKFRAWLLSIYKEAKALNVSLTDEVRGVMDRMLATDEQIKEAEAARGMGPLFKTAEQAGMTAVEWADYNSRAADATAQAIENLQARGLKDMQWLQNARSRKLKELQKRADGLRRAIRQEVRAEVMAEPVYRAWQFLTGKGEKIDTAQADAKVDRSLLDPTRDSLLVAIAKLGGINRASAKRDAGVHEDSFTTEVGVFGKPVFRKEGGANADDMAMQLAEAHYLPVDENGKHSLADLEQAIADELGGEPRYSYWHDYARDLEASGQRLPENVMFGKLDTSRLKDMYGNAPDALWRKLSALRMTSEANGIDPDIVAETFEFSSGDELVQAIASAVPPKEVIEAKVDERMLGEFGDLATPEGLERATNAAVHNEARAKFVAAEFAALEKANAVRQKIPGTRRTVDVLAKAAKDYAEGVISALRIRDLRPGKYEAAEARAARNAEKAMAKGDIETAAAEKRNQMIQSAAARAAESAQAEMDRARDYFKRFDKRSKTIDASYQDQIEGLLERFELRKISDKASDQRKSLAAWVEDQRKLGLEPDLPDSLLADAGKTSFRDMTVEEARGLRDAIRQIEHLGRLKKKLLLARDRKAFEAVTSEMAASIALHGGKARPVELEGARGLKPWLEGVAASHRKLASLFRQMDGGQDGGPMYERIGRAMNERGALEDVMVEQATEALTALYAPLMGMRGGITGSRSKVFIPEIKASLTRGGRLAVALNWGNEQNRQRLRDGDKWSDGQIQAILKTLTQEELKFVNGVWAYLDSYWPEIAAKEKRLTGAEPERVAPVPFTAIAADGSEVQMRGGYYPLKYDTDRSDQAEKQEAAKLAQEMMAGAFTRATTRRGHTKARAEEVKRAVRKDLNVITQHVVQVTHDLAWHEWLIDTNRLLRDDDVVQAIRDHYGPKVLKTIRDGVMGIATADVVPMTDIDKGMLLLRSNVTRATMGASLTTAFLQPFGLTQSMVRIGSRHVLRGIARWGGDAIRMESTLGWIHDKSEFMRLRSKTFNRELREVSGVVSGKSKAMRVVDAGLFVMMQKMQLVADVPTWIGQYEKTMAEGPEADTDEARDALESKAIAMADRAVLESQGGGATKDLAEVQRKHPMLTQFYSYFSVTLNLTAESTAATDFKNPRAVAGWLGDMALLLAIPAILPAILLESLKGGGDDDEGMAMKIAKWQLGYLLGMVVGLREVSGAVSGFDYAGPPVSRVVTDVGKAGQQTAQGEIDEPAVLAYVRLLGSVFGIPVVQAVRSYKGWKAWDEGEAGPQAVLFGPPPKH